MRTQLGPVTSGQSGKFRVTFQTYAGAPGNEHLKSVAGSAEIFETEDEAYAAGNRALQVLEDTGMFPNLCEAF
jgi:hypothetical protein